MGKKGLVSVIVPVYNTAEFLGECVESILGQSYEDLEVILVDDGSKDGSGEMCEEFEDARVRVFHKKNGGLSSARNMGLERARGEFVTFVDSDDYLGKEAISNWVKAGAEIVVSPHVEVFENGREVDFNGGEYRGARLDKAEALRRMLNERGFNLEATGKLYRRELWEGVRFPEGRLHEDVGTTYKAFLKNSGEVAFLEKGEYYYRQREGSIARGEFRKQRLDLVEMTDEMCDEIEAEVPGLLETTRLRRMHARFSILRMVAGEKKNAGVAKEMLGYLRGHKSWVLKNPEAGMRDKMAMRAAMMGEGAFRRMWKIYEKVRHFGV